MAIPLPSIQGFDLWVKKKTSNKKPTQTRKFQKRSNPKPINKNIIVSASPCAGKH